MDKIETLQELRAVVKTAITVGVLAIEAEFMDDNRYELTGYKNMRAVVVYSPNGIRLCARSNKMEGETEIMTASKNHLLSPDGPSIKLWNRIEQRVASFLEKRGLYKDRECISDKTGELF